MFCYQCQETLNNDGCFNRGVCGKTDEVANLQDLLIYLLKGLSLYGVKARALGLADPATDLFVAEALFTTLSNVNFDPERIAALIAETITRRDGLRQRCLAAGATFNGLPEMATWRPGDGSVAGLAGKGAAVSLAVQRHPNEDIVSLRELLTYGVKGLAAYTDHLAVLDKSAPELLAFLQTALAATADDTATVGELVSLALECGQRGVEVLAGLDEAHTGRYGHPEPTAVDIGVRPGPAILITGHDLRDLEDLLAQTAGTGINVYTHGEMLPAHAYPAFKKYSHLAGNYGGAWWQQQDDFEAFNGPIVVTTNCLQKPRSSYEGRIFTTGLVGWEGVAHIPDRQPGGRKDFSRVIAAARECGSPTPLETGTITVGFAHQAILSRAGAVIDAIKSGAIKRFVVMAGCDGRQFSRQYYTDVAAGLPADAVILTAGCAKYRYNKLNLGDIGGIPRVLDAGQCNDSYSLVAVALKLAEVFGVDSVNDLPISYDIAWYEQKAVLVLLALLYLNVKKIHLGPTLPAFLSPNVTRLLVEQFDLRPITTPEQDVIRLMAGA